MFVPLYGGNRWGTNQPSRGNAEKGKSQNQKQQKGFGVKYKKKKLGQAGEPIGKIDKKKNHSSRPGLHAGSRKERSS